MAVLYKSYKNWACRLCSTKVHGDCICDEEQTEKMKERKREGLGKEICGRT